MCYRMNLKLIQPAIPKKLLTKLSTERVSVLDWNKAYINVEKAYK